MDVSKLNQLGWKHEVKLIDCIKKTYNWFLENEGNYKEVKI